ncbi:MAG: helix-turn-helix domain-containing protein [Candidatus Leucobacter sulfamidivorax]|jgi:AraC-like DNA-binding protein|nr:helix-turn-helix domain-containing protein [Candidatus Leucobacter sulfamidivorax]
MGDVAVSAASVRTVESREIDEYADLVSERFAPLKMDTRRRGDFRGCIRGRRFDDIRIFDVRATQHSVERGERIVSSTPQSEYMLHLQLSGVGIIRQDGREATLQPGDLAFYDSDAPYSMGLDDQFRNAILVFPQRSLAMPPALISQLTAVRIPGAEGIAGMVGSMLTELVKNMEGLPRVHGARFTQGVVDLLSAALQAELGAPRDLSVSDSQDLSLQQVLAYIEGNLSDPDLGPEQVAAATFMSVRALHALFSRTGTTVAAWIRNRRLELCYEDLSSPRLRQLSVGAVMNRHGFVCAPHFSRLFKSAYGEPPVRFRERMIAEGERGLQRLQ